MVCALSIANNPDDKACGVTVNFRKDRAAAVEPRRSLTYSLKDEELVLRTDVEVVGNCEDAILTILWDNYRNGVKEVRTAAICDEAMARFNKTRKTVENTLPNLKRGKTPKVVTAGRGRVSLSPAEIQKRQQAEGPAFIPNRTLSKTGGERKRSQSTPGSCLPPNESPKGKVGENRSPQGKSSGETQIPLPDSVLTHYHPVREKTPQRTFQSVLPGDDDPNWGPRPDS